MSAYVVEPETIGRIIAAIREDTHSSRPPFGMVGRLVREKGWPLDTPEDEARLASAMHAMNVDAVCYRYKGDTPEMYPAPAYRPMAPDTIVSTIKALDCYLYQCSEGSVPDRTLFKLLDEVRGTLALAIVRATERYKGAHWG